MQMVIYLVPHITGGEAFEDAGNGTEDLARAKESLWNLLADYSEGKFSKEAGDEQEL